MYDPQLISNIISSGNEICNDVTRHSEYTSCNLGRIRNISDRFHNNFYHVTEPSECKNCPQLSQTACINYWEKYPEDGQRFNESKRKEKITVDSVINTRFTHPFCTLNRVYDRNRPLFYPAVVASTTVMPRIRYNLAIRRDKPLGVEPMTPEFTDHCASGVLECKRVVCTPSRRLHYIIVTSSDVSINEN